MKQFGGLFLTFAILAISGLQPAVAEWRIYENPRFGFKFTYPSHFFAPEPEPENANGHRFFSIGAEANISTWGSNNQLNLNPRSYFKWLRDDVEVVDNVTYKRIAKDWVVISGFKGDMVYYEKTIFTCNFQQMTSISMSYPASLKKDFDRMLGKITKSLKPGRPNRCG